MMKYSDDRVPNTKITILRWVNSTSKEFKLKFRSEVDRLADFCKKDIDEDVK